MELRFKLIRIANPLIPGETDFVHIQAASLAKYNYGDDLITPQCKTKRELDFQIDYMIKELENIRKEGHKVLP